MLMFMFSKEIEVSFSFCPAVYSVHIFNVFISGSEFSRTCVFSLFLSLYLSNCLSIFRFYPFCYPYHGSYVRLVVKWVDVIVATFLWPNEIFRTHFHSDDSYYLSIELKLFANTLQVYHVNESQFEFFIHLFSVFSMFVYVSGFFNVIFSCQLEAFHSLLLFLSIFFHVFFLSMGIK